MTIDPAIGFALIHDSARLKGKWAMVVKERRDGADVFVARDTKNKNGTGNGDRKIEWKVPRGNDLREVARDATGQAIENYSEALKKLKKH